MAKDESRSDINKIITIGIAASAATAIEDAQRHHVPLVVWRNGGIVEVTPSESKPLPQQD